MSKLMIADAFDSAEEIHWFTVMHFLQIANNLSFGFFRRHIFE